MSHEIETRLQRHYRVDKRSQRIKEGRSLDTFSSFLPSFFDGTRNLCFIDLLDELEEGSRVLFYDHGQHSQALEELKNKYSHIEFVGTSNANEAEHLLSERGASFDIICGLHALRHGSLNQILSWKKMYRALNENGILLINSLYVPLAPIVMGGNEKLEAKYLQKILVEMGYNVQLQATRDSSQEFHMNIAMRKNEALPTLELPIELINTAESSDGGIINTYHLTVPLPEDTNT